MADVENAHLCQKCQAFFQRLSNRPVTVYETYQEVEIDWHSTLEEFKQFAETCPLCHEFWLTISSEEWYNEPIKVSAVEIHAYVEFSEPQIWKIGFWARNKQEMSISGDAQRLFSPHAREEVLLPWIESQEWKPRLLHSRGLDIAKKWLSLCCAKHSHGETLRAGDWRPSRLVKIFQDNVRKARLVERVDIPQQSPYLTLSHRWGQDTICKLETDTLDQFKENIPLCNLSRTFQDAIEVTEYLGFEYIWIDSLCIIQDSRDDWAAEVTQMAKIYEYATCNIAAIARRASELGLCINDPNRHARSIQVSVDMRVGENHLKGMHILFSNSVWRSRVNLAPLNRRGWVLQENYLSPRIVYFSEDQMLWKCREWLACETWPLGFNPSRMMGDTVHWPFLYSTVDPNNVRRDSLADVETAWRDLVQVYSNCALTRPSDKLPALAGIMDKYQRHLNDVYVAGLWKRSLLRDLLWHRTPLTRTRRLCPKRHMERAPSWSWACLDIPVKFPLRTYSIHPDRCLAKIIKLQIFDDAAGYLKVDSITINAPLLKAINKMSPPSYFEVHNIYLQHTYFSASSTYDQAEGDADNLLLSPEQKQLIVVHADPDELETPLIWVYLIFFSSGDYAEGLLVKRLPQRGRFMRIGYFEFWTGKTPDLDVLLKDTFPIHDDDYENSQGNGIYTITLQ